VQQRWQDCGIHTDQVMRSGREMASVKDIVDGDGRDLTWLEALDTDGKRWKYHKGAPAQAQGPIHIYQHENGSLEIMPDGHGGVLLHQDGGGLPHSMNVRLAPPPSPGAGLPVVGGWGGGVFMYEQR
jgi:hypothetical protein